MAPTFDPRLAQEVLRRAAKTKSDRTGRAISDSVEHTEVTGTIGPATITFGFTGPPQINRTRAYQLAHYQISGFYFFQSYNNALQMGGRLPGVFAPAGFEPQTNWGASGAVKFSNVTADWAPRFSGTTAQGYFRFLIKRSSSEQTWSWAMEWNGTHRIFGFFGDKDEIDALFKAPAPSPLAVKDANEHQTHRVTTETPLDPTAPDRFFFERQTQHKKSDQP